MSDVLRKISHLQAGTQERIATEILDYEVKE